MKKQNGNRKRPDAPPMEQVGPLTSQMKSARARSLGELQFLKEGKTFYKSLVELSPVGICVVVEGRFYFANRAMAGIVGVASPDELLGNKLSDFLHPDSRSAIDDFAACKADYQESDTVTELKILRTDGTTNLVEVVAAPLFYYGVQATEMMVSDVSELKRTEARRAKLERLVSERTAELAARNEQLMKEIEEHNRARRALQESEERFKVVVQSATDLIFTKDRELRYTMVNPAMEKLHGRNAAEIIGLQAEDLHSKEEAKRIKAVDLRVLAGETVDKEYTTSIRGSRMAFHAIRAPLKDAAGNIYGICGIVRNTTERKFASAPPELPDEMDYPSPAMRFTLKQARIAAASDSIVLLMGESGCGKDYLARWIHDHSKRASGPYFSINCAAIAKELAESELFGHEAGAFTGARGARKGLLQLAEGGTLLLNEIGELPISLQAKLLTFLDTKLFLPVGGEKHVRVSARIMAATHRNLLEESEKGRFLSALYYRLNVFTLDVPPLRDRKEDIPLLIKGILSRLAAELQLTELPEIDSANIAQLRRHDWPGNVRELRNVMERALMLWDRGKFNVNPAMPTSKHREWCYTTMFPSGRSLHELTDEFRYSLCLEALRRADGGRYEAARLLKVSRGALYRYMKRGSGSREIGTED